MECAMPDPIEALENREQQLRSEEKDALADSLRTELEMLALANEVERPSELNEEAGNARRELYRSSFVDARVDTATIFSGLTGIRNEYHTRVADALQKSINIKQERVLQTKYVDWNLLHPAPDPPEFWWASTQPFDTSGHTMGWRDDGLHIVGGPKLDTWNGERHENFGAVAVFTIAADRFPRSAPPSGWWLSAPFAELFGGMVVYSPDYDLLEGHGIASVQLHLRQTLFQFDIGEHGPGRIVLGEGVSDGSWLISLEDTGYSSHQAMPGGISVPKVRFQETNRAKQDTLFAEVEVRFDIHLKSAGALVWCDPEIILRNFQWPLTPEI
jgi:hypothetical protein